MDQYYLYLPFCLALSQRRKPDRVYPPGGFKDVAKAASDKSGIVFRMDFLSLARSDMSQRGGKEDSEQTQLT
jgi:hypothetical protein